MVRAEFIRPLTGRCVVFTGRLQRLSREDAHALAVRLGGQCQESVNEMTDFVVIGSADRQTITSGQRLRIQEAVQPFRAAGQAIQVISEDEFLGLIISPQG